MIYGDDVKTKNNVQILRDGIQVLFFIWASFYSMVMILALNSV
jgi:hypothetical protein